MPLLVSHNKPELPVGTIGVKEGPLMAVGPVQAEITGVKRMRQHHTMGTTQSWRLARSDYRTAQIVARHTSH